MELMDFSFAHIPDALELLRVNYEEERQAILTLPPFTQPPSLDGFVRNGLGAAAYEGGEMLGFLCCYPPIDFAFGVPGLKGTFSPIHGHGAAARQREKVYARLYQAAAEKWARQGIVSHAIGLYAHDMEGLQSFFTNGFGLRTMDAIRPLQAIPSIEGLAFQYTELEKVQAGEIVDLRNGLLSHLAKSPTFMHFPPMSREQASKLSEERHSRIFTASLGTRRIAFLEITDRGENFVCDDPGMMNICGAYCLCEFRGTGAYHNLLCHVIHTLQSEGYTWLGVDFESFNPTARGFWLKHFQPYTSGLVRRIDGLAASSLA